MFGEYFLRRIDIFFTRILSSWYPMYSLEYTLSRAIWSGAWNMAQCNISCDDWKRSFFNHIRCNKLQRPSREVELPSIFRRLQPTFHNALRDKLHEKLHIVAAPLIISTLGCIFYSVELIVSRYWKSIFKFGSTLSTRGTLYLKRNSDPENRTNRPKRFTIEPFHCWSV